MCLLYVTLGRASEERAAAGMHDRYVCVCVCACVYVCVCVRVCVRVRVRVCVWGGGGGWSCTTVVDMEISGRTSSGPRVLAMQPWISGTHMQRAGSFGLNTTVHTYCRP